MSQFHPFHAKTPGTLPPRKAMSQRRHKGITVLYERCQAKARGVAGCVGALRCGADRILTILSLYLLLLLHIFFWPIRWWYPGGQREVSVVASSSGRGSSYAYRSKESSSCSQSLSPTTSCSQRIREAPANAALQGLSGVPLSHATRVTSRLIGMLRFLWRYLDKMLARPLRHHTLVG
jgi:hypothetical protein